MHAYKKVVAVVLMLLVAGLAFGTLSDQGVSAQDVTIKVFVRAGKDGKFFGAKEFQLAEKDITTITIKEVSNITDADAKFGTAVPPNVRLVFSGSLTNPKLSGSMVIEVDPPVMVVEVDVTVLPYLDVSVGGVASLLGESASPADASESSSGRDYTAPIAASVAAAVLALAAGGWYVRRRWQQ